MKPQDRLAIVGALNEAVAEYRKQATLLEGGGLDMQDGATEMSVAYGHIANHPPLDDLMTTGVNRMIARCVSTPKLHRMTSESRVTMKCSRLAGFLALMVRAGTTIGFEAGRRVGRKEAKAAAGADND